jgi:hypothetical protein
MKRCINLCLSLALVAMLGYGATSCSKADKLTGPEVSTTQTTDTTHVQKPEANSAASYPSWAYMMMVPWMPQVPPGDWANTKNCGQACCAMLGAWFNHTSLNADVIRAENRYLKYPDAWIENGNPDGTGAYTLQSLLLGYHQLRSTISTGMSAADVVNQVVQNRPVMVAVRTRMSTTGAPHWMICTGWDTKYMYFNDPGRSFMSSDFTAGSYRCTPAVFEASWNSFPRTPRLYMSVYR